MDIKTLIYKRRTRDERLIQTNNNGILFNITATILASE